VVSATPAAGITPERTDITAQIHDLSVRTSMEPGHPGRNNLVVQIHGAGATEPVSGVQVVLAQPGQMTQTLDGHPLGGGRYEFPPVPMAEAGRLDVQVTITRFDGSLERTNWTWTVTPVPQAPPPGLPATPWASDLNMAAAVVAVALLSAWATWLLLDRRRRSFAGTAAGR
jgi:hypothetical protein